MPVSVLIGRPGDIPPGESAVVTVGNRTIAVFHHGGQFFAINDACPHAGASLSEGSVAGGVVTCPMHAWRFRLADGTGADYPKVKAACYRVTVIDTEVRVEVPD